MYISCILLGVGVVYKRSSEKDYQYKGIYFYINNLFIYYVERKLLNRLYVYQYKMVEIYMLLC